MYKKEHPKIDLIFEVTCPNVDLARSRLRSAFIAAGLTPHWREWERNSADTPDEFRQFGAPTILVDGHDVSPAEQGDAETCRLYSDAEGKLDRAPTVASIVEKLSL